MNGQEIQVGQDEVYVLQGIGVRLARNCRQLRINRKSRWLALIHVHGAREPAWFELELIFPDRASANAKWHEAKRHRDEQARQGRDLAVVQAIRELVFEGTR